MAGAAPTPTGKGGKKPLDASINLVPFIDLLSCCISFLLITAVWTQLARMDVTQKSKAPSGAEPEQNTPTVQLTLYINQDGYIFSKSTGESTPIEKKGEEYDYVKLSEIMQQAKKDHPDKDDITIKSDDNVIYNKIIKTMDIVISSKFPNVSLTDKGAGG
jgi:biopolymer transport protein TolR